MLLKPTPMKNICQVIGGMCGTKKAFEVISVALSSSVNSPFKRLFCLRDIFVICIGDRDSVRDLHDRRRECAGA
jgi:hypothetical protein